MMKWIPNDGVFLIDLDKDLTHYKMKPHSSVLVNMSRASLQALVVSAGFVGNTNKMNRHELADLCVENWTKIVKAHAVMLSSWAIVDDEEAPTVKNLNEQSVFTPFHSFVTVEGVIRYNFWYASDTHFDVVFRLLQLEGFSVGSPNGKFEFVLRQGTSTASSHEVISNWGGNNSTFHLVSLIVGGVVHVKKSLKKDDAITTLLTKSKTRIISKRSGSYSEIAQTNPPVAFAEILRGYETRIAQFRQMMIEGNLTMTSFLEKLSDEKLDDLVKIFEYQTNYHSEDKILDSIDIMYEDAQVLDELPNHLKRVKLSIVMFFLELFAKQFSILRGSNIQYDNKGFLEAIGKIKDYRRGYRAHSENSDVTAALNEPVVSDGSCDLM